MPDENPFEALGMTPAVLRHLVAKGDLKAIRNVARSIALAYQREVHPDRELDDDDRKRKANELSQSLNDAVAELSTDDSIEYHIDDYLHSGPIDHALAEEAYALRKAETDRLYRSVDCLFGQSYALDRFRILGVEEPTTLLVGDRSRHIIEVHSPASSTIARAVRPSSPAEPPIQCSGKRGVGCVKECGQCFGDF